MGYDCADFREKQNLENSLYYSKININYHALIVYSFQKFCFSWPTILGADDRMTFTCETTSTIQYILANVLNTFLDPSHISMLQDRLPVDEYGLKVSNKILLLFMNSSIDAMSLIVIILSVQDRPVLDLWFG